VSTVITSSSFWLEKLDLDKLKMETN